MKMSLSRWWRRRSRPDPLSPDLRRQLESVPQARVRVIAHVVDDPEAHRADVEGLGLRVHRVFKLTPGLAIEGAADAVLKLAAQPWVVTIEADRAVHTMPKEDIE